MDEDNMPEFGGESAKQIMSALDNVDEMVTMMTRMRNQLVDQGFNPMAADAAAIQLQQFLHGSALEQQKAELRPKGIFG